MQHTVCHLDPNLRPQSSTAARTWGSASLLLPTKRLAHRADLTTPQAGDAVRQGCSETWPEGRGRKEHGGISALGQAFYIFISLTALPNRFVRFKMLPHLLDKETDQRSSLLRTEVTPGMRDLGFKTGVVDSHATLNVANLV